MPKTSIIDQVVATLGHKRLFYVCRELERAMPLASQPGCFIISNDSDFARLMAKKHSNIILVKNKIALDTRLLLEHPETANIIQAGDLILVFKNTSQIEKICTKNNWQLINPPAKISNTVEEKISQAKWLGPLKKYFPPFTIATLEKIKWTGEKFVLQFNRSHTGSGTIMIESENQLTALAEKFPKREVKITKFISGPFFTNNNVVWGKNIICERKVLVGNISYQITGLPPFTDNPFATIGNDWAWPTKFLNKKQLKRYCKIATKIGKRLAKAGWQGLFGIDTVVDETTGKIYLIEINCRQPASTTLESALQNLAKTIEEKSSTALTTFEAHLAALLKIKNRGYNLIKITDGAQIIQRVLSEPNSVDQKRSPTAAELQTFGNLQVITYSNTEPGNDLVRMQSRHGIIQSHNVLKKYA